MKSDALLESTIEILRENILLEVNPSTLKKVKDTTKQNKYRPADGDYEHIPFDYNLSGSRYEGNIQDKKGNNYKVYASVQEKDTGSIAGGTYDFNVFIEYNNHRIDLGDSMALFSTNDGPQGQLLTDIENGMYLEDYLQKHIKSVESVSNIQDWMKIKKDSNNDISMSIFNFYTLWIQENIISENNDYDERTSVDKRIDKKNQNVFVGIWENIQAYITESGIKIANDCELKKYLYTGGKGSDKYKPTNDVVNIPKDTQIVFSDFTKNNILEQINPKKYNIDITYNELSNIIFTLGPVYGVFKYSNNQLKEVYREFKFESIKVKYYPQNQADKNNKLNQLMIDAKINIEDAPKVIYNIYKDITSRLNGIDDVTVEIVLDGSKLRARGDDGIHGEAWVQFPKDLRSYGKRYKVDKLVWNGKNYTVKGNIQEIK